MKPTVTLRWKVVGFTGAIALGGLLAIMPTKLAGASLESRLAEMAATMPPGGFSIRGALLAEWLTSAKPVVILDVREHWAFDEFHIEGSEHRSAAEVVSPASIRALPADRPIVVVGDEAAGQTAALLRLAGKDAFSLEGGIGGWWLEVLTPASADRSIPAGERPTAAARRLAWRARFLGAASAGSAAASSAPSVATPPPAAPRAPGKPAARGKGC